LGAGDWFGVTLTGLWQHAEKHEPGAANNQSRIAALLAAHEKGVKTWVSCEPVIDTTAIYGLIEQAHYIDLFRIGKMNHNPSGINWAEFGARCVELCKANGRAYYIKDDLLKEMEGRQ
jgi:DNA repair photolyase